MQTLDYYLSYVTRRLRNIRGGWRIAERLRRFYAPKYRGNPNSWVLINDIDRDIKMRVDRAGYFGSIVYWHGYHHSDELIILNKFLKPEMVFVDIGANQGEFALFAAKRLTQGRVLAFEPMDEMHRHLLENVELNHFHNVVTHHCGLAESAGERAMYTSQDVRLFHSVNEGLASIFPSKSRSTPMGNARFEVFDSIFKASKLNRLDMIKIDVEGAELPVLMGASAMLKQYKPALIIEINNETFETAGYSTRHLIDFLNSLNYSVALIGKGGQLMETPWENLPVLCNVLCR